MAVSCFLGAYSSTSYRLSIPYSSHDSYKLELEQFPSSSTYRD